MLRLTMVSVALLGSAIVASSPGGAAQRGTYSRSVDYTNVSAGVTHELRGQCDYGSFVVNSSYSTNAEHVVVNGPHTQDQRTIFYQTYRPTASGAYEFRVTVTCRS